LVLDIVGKYGNIHRGMFIINRMVAFFNIEERNTI